MQQPCQALMGAEVEMIKGARAVDRAPNASRCRRRDTVEPRSQPMIEIQAPVAMFGWDHGLSRDRGECSSFASIRRRLG